MAGTATQGDPGKTAARAASQDAATAAIALSGTVVGTAFGCEGGHSEQANGKAGKQASTLAWNAFVAVLVMAAKSHIGAVRTDRQRLWLGRSFAPVATLSRVLGLQVVAHAKRCSLAKQAVCGSHTNHTLQLSQCLLQLLKQRLPFCTGFQPSAVQ